MPTQAAILAAAHNTAPAPAQGVAAQEVAAQDVAAQGVAAQGVAAQEVAAQGVAAQGVAASVVSSACVPPKEASSSQAPVLTTSSAPRSQAELPTRKDGLQATATAAGAAAADAAAQTASMPISTAPVSIVGLTAKVNCMLVGPYQLSKQQAEQMQAAFGDVKLMQDLRHMDGDLLNGQLRVAAGLNALQICVVRQVLCVLQ